jgi:hypothetical protein
MASIWRSDLKEGIDAIKMASAPASGWLDAIKGLVNKGAAKAAEVEWSGINDWLDMQQSKVSKADITRFLADNGVRVEETVLSGKVAEDTRNILQERIRERKEALSALGYSVRNEYGDAVLIREVDGYQFFYKYDGFYDGDGNLLDGLAADAARSLGNVLSLGTAMDELDNLGGVRVLPKGDSRYGKYTLPGGSNYREVLLTLPTGGPSNVGAMSDAELRALIQRNDDDAEVDGVSRADLMVMIDGMELGKDDISKLTGKNTAQYKSFHWDQPNVLAHIRLNDRTDADGKKVLFVEEIQSDWSQQGRQNGFSISAAERAEADALTAKADRAGGVHNLTDGEQARAKELGKKLIGSQIPLAPFVTNTEGWLNLALKRVIKMAVDGGYHKVAFVNGEQSAERYDLSKQVDRIYHYLTSTGHHVSILGKDGNSMHTGTHSASELGNIVGKDIAKK